MTSTPTVTDLAAAAAATSKRLASEGATLLRRAQEWTPSTVGGGGDGPRAIGGHSDPTASSAIGRDAKSNIYAADQTAKRFNKAMRALLMALNEMEHAMNACIPSRVEREQGNDLETINSRYGMCQVCSSSPGGNTHHHTGQADDRLRPINTGERRDSEPFTPLACNRCRVSWDGRSDDVYDQRQDFDTWSTDRLYRLASAEHRTVTLDVEVSA